MKYLYLYNINLLANAKLYDGHFISILDVNISWCSAREALPFLNEL